MSYDPNLPQAGTEIDAVQMRAQFNGLKDLIDALPAINAAVVDDVTTGNPGDPAAVNLSVVGSTLHFSFALPRGADGTDGTNGTSVGGAIVDAVTTLEPEEPATAAADWDGSNIHFTFGLPRGNVGLPFGETVVDAVDTLDPDEPATVQTSFDGSSVHFTFGIPRGNDGGPGPPGGVTTEQLETAIAAAFDGTSSNSNTVNPLALTVSDPPTQAEMQAMADKLEELITALRR